MCYEKCDLTLYEGMDIKMCYVHVWRGVEAWTKKHDNKFPGCNADQHKEYVSELVRRACGTHAPPIFALRLTD